MSAVTCGEATIRLLRRYGVTTVFGIPGVHTLDFCRGLSNGDVRHIQARNEQGAGFMAEGWARATGQPGVALVISGPGVTNATTALGQAYADSLPMLLLSAEPASESIGKGWGVLHEITEQKKVTAPLTALSVTARRAADVPEYLAQAFTLFASGRPRPVHISVPVDVQAELVKEEWQPVVLPARPYPRATQIQAAASLLRGASAPLLLIGGGAADASAALTLLAEKTGALVVSSTAGKGIVPDTHPLAVAGSTVRPEVQAELAKADVILAIGTELSETDSFVDRLDLRGDLIRVDIDPQKISDFYPPSVGIVADAKATATLLVEALDNHQANHRPRTEQVATKLHTDIRAHLSPSEEKHTRLLAELQRIAPSDTIWAGDACQLVYTGAFAMHVQQPRQWLYPAGYCALGNALPNAIGAKLARPRQPLAVMVGDGGFMFTMPELMTAAELKLNLPIVLWENGGLKQIQDDMDARDIRRVGVEGLNPDFVGLAEACYCNGVRPGSMAEFAEAFTSALAASEPTLIVVEESADWLG